MANRLCFYKDNILSKMELNEAIKQILDFLRFETNEDAEIRIKKSTICKHKITFNRKVLIKLLEELKEKNDNLIDNYLEMSFNGNYVKNKRKEQ